MLCNLFCAAGGSAIGILLSMLCVIGFDYVVNGRGGWHGVRDDQSNVAIGRYYRKWWKLHSKRLSSFFLQTAICAVGTGYYLAKRDLFAREGEG